MNLLVAQLSQSYHDAYSNMQARRHGKKNKTQSCCGFCEISGHLGDFSGMCVCVFFYQLGG